MISIDTIKKGSESSFAKLFNVYHAKLYFYFLKKTKSDVTAQELTQLTFIKLWRFRHTLSEEIAFDKQLFTMAISVLIDFVRQQKTRQQKFVVVDHIADRLQKTEAEEPSIVFENEDYFSYLANSLPPVRKKVFTLSRVYGFSYKEIAEQLSISVKTVEDHIGKALKQLRTIRIPVLLFIILLCLH